MTRQVTDQGLQAAARLPEAALPALLQPPEAVPPALLQPPELVRQLGLGLTEHAALSLPGNRILIPNRLVSSNHECANVLQPSQGTCAEPCLRQQFVHSWLVAVREARLWL